MRQDPDSQDQAIGPLVQIYGLRALGCTEFVGHDLWSFRGFSPESLSATVMKGAGVKVPMPGAQTTDALRPSMLEPDEDASGSL